MRIGLFVDAYIPEINGVVTSTKTLFDALSKKGDDVFVVTTNPFNNEILVDGNIIRLPGVELKKLYGYRVASPYSRKAEKIINNLHLEVIHVQTELSIGIFGRLYAKKYNLPIVYTYHTMYIDYTYYITKGVLDPIAKGFVKKISKFLAESSTELITTSNKTKNALRSYNINQYINVIPNGVDIEKYNREQFDESEFIEFRRKNDLLDKYLILSLGRVAKEKSLDVCINEYAKFIEETKDEKTIYLIVGDGPQKEEYEKLVLDLGLAERVKFLGKVSHDETPFYYALCDLYISASTSETQGLTFIEAMASKIPVLCMYDDNLNEVVIDGETGIFFYTEKECHKKLNEVINFSEEKREEIINKAYKNIEKYSVDIFSDSVKEVYYRAIREHW